MLCITAVSIPTGGLEFFTYAVTLIIWDYDKSFVNALVRLLSVFRKILELQQIGRGISQEVIKDGISVLTWFLIHINDILTGDELFILNLHFLHQDYHLHRKGSYRYDGHRGST